MYSLHKLTDAFQTSSLFNRSKHQRSPNKQQMKERLIRFKHAPSESLVGSKQQQIWSKSRIFRYIFRSTSFSFQICPIKITLRCIVCSCCFNSNSDANSINTYLSCGQGKKGTNDWTVNLLKNIRIIMCERVHERENERNISNGERGKKAITAV